MAEPKNKGKPDAEQDQSMEEILQSIRRIIAEEGDEPAAQAAEEPAATLPKGSSVLELTDVVKDDGSVINVNSQTAAPMDKKDVLADIDHVLTNPAPGEGLLSKDNAFAAAAALKPVMDLTHRVAPAPAPRTESASFRSGVTVEDLAMEAITPMLKNWLDTNLKGIVERLVEKEIKRIVALNNE